MVLLQRALELSDLHNAIVHKNLALALSMSGDHEAAVSHYAKSVELYPTSDPPPKA